MESQKIIATLAKMLKLENRTKKRRGINYIKEVSQNGESIKTSINKIRESLPVEDFNMCQQAFYEMKLLIKKKLENIGEKLK